MQARREATSGDAGGSCDRGCGTASRAERGQVSVVSEEAVAGRSVSQTPSRARLAALLVLVALLPLLALAWVAATGVGRSETRKADLRLESEGRSASAVFVRSVAEAATRAGTLAASPALQRGARRARPRHDCAASPSPHDVVVAGGQVLSGRPEPLAVHRSVVGRRRRSSSRLCDRERTAERRAAAAPALRGRPRTRATDLRSAQRPRDRGSDPGAAAVPVGRSIDRNLGGTNYRSLRVRLVGPPDDVELLALTPRSDISGGRPRPPRLDAAGSRRHARNGRRHRLRARAAARRRAARAAGDPRSPRCESVRARRRRARLDARSGQAPARDPPRDDGRDRRRRWPRRAGRTRDGRGGRRRGSGTSAAARPRRRGSRRRDRAGAVAGVRQLRRADARPRAVARARRRRSRSRTRGCMPSSSARRSPTS